MRRKAFKVAAGLGAYLGAQFSMQEYQRRVNGLEPLGTFDEIHLYENEKNISNIIGTTFHEKFTAEEM